MLNRPLEMLRSTCRLLLALRYRDAVIAHCFCGAHVSHPRRVHVTHQTCAAVALSVRNHKGARESWVDTGPRGRSDYDEFRGFE